MIIAATRPTTSLLSVLGSESSVPIGPPAATSIPAFRAGSAVATTSCAISSVNSSPPTSSSTGMSAVCLSLLICEAPCWLNGSVALATCGSFTIAWWESSIACLFVESVTWPVSTWKTIGLLPFCCGGKRSASRSVAAWLSVPGSSRLLLVLLPNVRTSKTTAAAARTHPPMTTHYRRAANIPSPCRRRAIGVVQLSLALRRVYSAKRRDTHARARQLSVAARVSKLASPKGNSLASASSHSTASLSAPPWQLPGRSQEVTF
jgi:hypothetical protein